MCYSFRTVVAGNSSADLYVRKKGMGLIRAVCYNRNNTLTMEPGEALGIAAQIAVGKRLEPGIELFRRFGVMEATIIDGKPAAAVLSVDFDETFAETDIAPAIILLRLHCGRNNRIDSDN